MIIKTLNALYHRGRIISTYPNTSVYGFMFFQILYIFEAIDDIVYRTPDGGYNFLTLHTRRRNESNPTPAMAIMMMTNSCGKTHC